MEPRIASLESITESTGKALEELRRRVDEGFRKLRCEMREQRAEFNSRLNALRNELRSEIRDTRSESNDRYRVLICMPPSIRRHYVSDQLVTISSAIRNRRLISFNYHGDARTVEPHTYGVDLKGHRALCAFQVAGGSSSGVYVGWKTFHIDEMENVVVLPVKFPGAREGYQCGDRNFNMIIAEL